MSDNKLWGRVIGCDLIIAAGKSPLAKVIEVVKCESPASAQKALNVFLKEIGQTYGGNQ